MFTLYINLGNFYYGYGLTVTLNCSHCSVSPMVKMKLLEPTGYTSTVRGYVCTWSLIVAMNMSVDFSSSMCCSESTFEEKTRKKKWSAKSLSKLTLMAVHSGSNLEICFKSIRKIIALLPIGGVVQQLMILLY